MDSSRKTLRRLAWPVLILTGRSGQNHGLISAYSARISYPALFCVPRASAAIRFSWVMPFTPPRTPLAMAGSCPLCTDASLTIGPPLRRRFKNESSRPPLVSFNHSNLPHGLTDNKSTTLALRPRLSLYLHRRGICADMEVSSHHA